MSITPKNKLYGEEIGFCLGRRILVDTLKQRLGFKIKTISRLGLEEFERKGF